MAGKNASVTSRLLDLFLNELHRGKKDFQPFAVIREYKGDLEGLLKKIGFGCQKAKARSLRELVNSGLDLRTCSADDLEGIYGIGPKTARCFLIHTRKNVRHAGIDTHLLKWLKSLGYDVPKSTPTGKVYKRLEEIFLSLADKLKMTPAVLDLAVWRFYSGNSGELPNLEIQWEQRA